MRTPNLYEFIGYFYYLNVFNTLEVGCSSEAFSLSLFMNGYATIGDEGKPIAIYYQQTSGVAISSPASPMAANLFMNTINGNVFLMHI